jgi:hypothetical protein
MAVAEMNRASDVGTYFGATSHTTLLVEELARSAAEVLGDITAE